jgi:hypothetical protein
MVLKSEVVSGANLSKSDCDFMDSITNLP